MMELKKTLPSTQVATDQPGKIFAGTGARFGVFIIFDDAFEVSNEEIQSLPARHTMDGKRT